MSSWSLDPVFIEGPAGKLFALQIGPPETAPKPQEAILYLPPFGEEMNRSRRMAGLLGRQMAERGLTFLMLDPYGTGDSDGDFQEVRWSIWNADAAAAIDWLKGQGFRRISVLGLRLGACLALRAAGRAGKDLSKIVVWQPVLKGETFINQFLRIRIAAGMAGSEGTEKETIKSLRARLAAGENLEVAGYALSGDLIQDLDNLDLVESAPAARPLAWLEINRNPEAKLTPASRKAIDALENMGIPVAAQTVVGEPFWSIEEPAYVPDLWAATLALWDDSLS